MRVFIIKLVNIFLIIIMLIVYQNIALERDKEVQAYNNKKLEAKKQWALVNENSSPYKDGTFQGQAEGYAGNIVSQVVVSGGSISQISIISEEGETPEYLKAAKDVILSEIIEYQDPDVDIVTSATLTSNGIINGVKKALEEASEK